MMERMTEEVFDAAAAIDDVKAGLDIFYLLFAGAVVFFMQTGFAMICAGTVRSKNVKNIMLKNLLDACGGALGFWSIGYGLAYGGSGNEFKDFIGNEYFFLRGMSTGGEYIGWFFQFAFAATAATIVAGSVAERCKMSAYFMYSFFLTGFVYPVVVYACWASSGFLTAFNADPLLGTGVIDFAGSGVVHMTGGCTALIAVIILGPRRGRFADEDGKVLDEPRAFPPSSTALQVLGTFILWFGWYGFNAGSTLLISDGAMADTAALCAVNTTLSAAAGCVTAMMIDSIVTRVKTGETVYDLGMAMNGCLSGLVAITAGCAVMTPSISVIVGMIGGCVYVGASKLLRTLKIDDVVDAIPVHFANGMWGVIAVGFFAEPSKLVASYGLGGNDVDTVGIFYGGGGALLACGLIQILFIIGWLSVLMIPFFYILKIAGMFRVDPEEEDIGLDISNHKGSAYNT